MTCFQKMLAGLPKGEVVDWNEDELQPRIVPLETTLWPWTRTVRVAHPEWLRPGDVLRPLPGREAVWVKHIGGDRIRLMRRVGCSFGCLRSRLFLVIGGDMAFTQAQRNRRYWRWRRWLPRAFSV